MSETSEDLPIAAAILIMIAVAALPLYPYFLMVQPFREKESSAVLHELSETEKHLEQARAAQRKLTEFHEEVDKLQKENSRLIEILPDSVSLEAFRALVEKRATTNHLQLSSFRFNGQHSWSGYVEHRHDAIVSGRFEDVSAFLQSFGGGPRLYDIPRIELRRAENVGTRPEEPEEPRNPGTLWTATARLTFLTYAP